MRPLRRCSALVPAITLLLIGASGACTGDSPTQPIDPFWEGPCPALGNEEVLGCARVLVQLSFVGAAWPDSLHSRIMFRVRGSAIGGGVLRPSNGTPHEVSYRLIAHRLPVAFSDTMSGWVGGELVRLSAAALTGVSAPELVAIDSVPHMVRWAAVGRHPSVDTVRLRFTRVP